MVAIGLDCLDLITSAPVVVSAAIVTIERHFSTAPDVFLPLFRHKADLHISGCGTRGSRHYSRFCERSAKVVRAAGEPIV